MYSTTLERLRKLPVHKDSDEVWEVGIVEVPMPVQEAADAPTWLPKMGLCVSSRGGVSASMPERPQDLRPTALLEALSAFALNPLTKDAKPLNYLPGRVRSMPLPRIIMTPFINAMRALGVSVEVKDDLPFIDDFMNSMLEHDDASLPDGAPRIPAIMKTQGITVDRVRSFAEAAAAFWKAHPWRLFDEEVAWEVSPRPSWDFFGSCLVMGGGGFEFGLAFLPRSLDINHMKLMGSLGGEPLAGWDTKWSLLYFDRNKAPAQDVALWSREGLSLAGPTAFPVALGITQAGKVLRPSPEQLTLVESLLRIFSTATQAEVHARLIKRTVTTIDGEVAFELKEA